jgi:excisionase family DNA binding protein
MHPEKLYFGVKAMPTVTNELLTRKDVARLFQVSPLTVIRLQEAGKLPAVTLGAGSIRYRRSDVEAFIQQSITPKGQA